MKDGQSPLRTQITDLFWILVVQTKQFLKLVKQGLKLLLQLLALGVLTTLGMLLWLSSLMISTCVLLWTWMKSYFLDGEKNLKRLLNLLHALGTLTPGIGKRTVNLVSSTVATKSTNATATDGSTQSTK